MKENKESVSMILLGNFLPTFENNNVLTYEQMPPPMVWHNWKSCKPPKRLNTYRFLRGQGLVRSSAP